MKIKIKLDLPPEEQLAEKFFDDDLKLFFGQEAARQMDAFVPYDSGMLSKNYTVTPKYIQYNQPYARRQYRGRHFKFSKDQHPLATAYWDRAMMKSRKDRLIRAVQKHMERRK